ncbi:MAG: MerR family transcriptional regulator [Bacteroidetes bacterium]|nr:MerR family transcriptional regulator [Bacteroidota bacterium]
MPVAIRKLYYSISEVSEITGLEAYVLRFWETEFRILTPAKNRSGNRIYTERDIQVVQVIKALLREKGYSIEAANDLLKLKTLDSLFAELRQPDLKTQKREALLSIRGELVELLNQLRS